MLKKENNKYFQKKNVRKGRERDTRAKKKKLKSQYQQANQQVVKKCPQAKKRNNQKKIEKQQKEQLEAPTEKIYLCLDMCTILWVIL